MNSFSVRGLKSFYTRLHHEEPQSFYRSPNKVRQNRSRILRRAGHVAITEKVMSAFQILTGKLTGKRPLGRPRRRWKDNKEIGRPINTRNCVDTAQDRDCWVALVNAALNLWVT